MYIVLPEHIRQSRGSRKSAKQKIVICSINAEMVNGLTSIALFQATDHSKLYNNNSFTILATFTHSYTDGRGCPASCQLHIRSNLGFSNLLKGTSACSWGSRGLALWWIDKLLFILSFSRLLTDSLLLSTGVLCPQPSEGDHVYTSTQTGHTGVDHRKDAQTGCKWFYSK